MPTTYAAQSTIRTTSGVLETSLPMDISIAGNSAQFHSPSHLLPSIFLPTSDCTGGYLPALGRRKIWSLPPPSLSTQRANTRPDRHPWEMVILWGRRME